jgi:hypothetical protein
MDSAKKYALGLSSLIIITAWFMFTLLQQVQLYNWLVMRPSAFRTMPIIAVLPEVVRHFSDQNIRYYYPVEK